MYDAYGIKTKVVSEEGFIQAMRNECAATEIFDNGVYMFWRIIVDAVNIDQSAF